MARNVFISFRYRDGFEYKDALSRMFDKTDDTVDFSEDKDRSQMSESTIKEYLYRKLRQSSITIVLLTPLAVNHRHARDGRYDDWMYDEIRYSLEDRTENRTNGLIAVYTPEAARMLVEHCAGGIERIQQFDNLCYHNMMNVKEPYKTNLQFALYDSDYDSYCSLVPWNTFVKNINKYIEIAAFKRENRYRYSFTKWL